MCFILFFFEKNALLLAALLSMLAFKSAGAIGLGVLCLTYCVYSFVVEAKKRGWIEQLNTAQAIYITGIHFMALWGLAVVCFVLAMPGVEDLPFGWTVETHGAKELLAKRCQCQEHHLGWASTAQNNAVKNEPQFWVVARYYTKSSGTFWFLALQAL